MWFNSVFFNFYQWHKMIFKKTHRAFFPLPTQKVFHILIFNNDWFYFTGISPVRLIWWLIHCFSVWNISPTRLCWWKNSYSLISKSGQALLCFSCLLLLIVQYCCSHTHTHKLTWKHPEVCAKCVTENYSEAHSIYYYDSFNNMNV